MDTGRTYASAFLLVAALWGVPAAAADFAYGDGDVREGDSFFEFGAQYVTDLSVAAQHWLVVAHRDGRRDPLQLAVFRAGKVETCTAGAELFRAVSGLQPLKLKRRLSADETERYQARSDAIEVRMRIDGGEPEEWDFYVDGHGGPVVVTSFAYRRAMAVTISAAPFLAFAQGCSRLGAKPKK